MSEFDKNYRMLNDAQKHAVDSIEGPVLVIAGPGTGKTQLLSMRVANILQKTDTDPSGILCLTFTNKAATNMRERLNQLIGPESRSVIVRTFHSFAAEIMNQYPDYFWDGAALSVAPDAVQDDIIQTILARLPLDNPLAVVFSGRYTALPAIKNALKLAKEAGLTPDQLRQIVKQNLTYLSKIEPTVAKLLSETLSIKKLPALQDAIASLPAQKLPSVSLILPLNEIINQSLALAVEQDQTTGKTTETGKWKQRWVQTVQGKKSMFKERKRNEWWLAVADVYKLYRQELHQRGYYDYSDMLIEVLEQLQKRPDMLADVQERFLYVLIDEFQDANAAQLRLAHFVADHYAANNKPNLMAVGDDDQTIFAFNGAELNNMLSFRRSYPSTKFIVLEHNYRSAQPVLDAASQIINQADDRLVKREASITKNLVAKNPPKGKVQIEHRSYPTRENQYGATVSQIEQLWSEGDRDIAVLARKHDSLRQLASILHRKGIPVSYEQQSNVFEHEAVKHACLIARLAVAIAEGKLDLVNLYISEVVRHPMWKLSSRTLWKLATDNFSSPDWLESLLTNNDENLNNLGNWLVWLARVCHEQPLPLMLEYILGLHESQYLQSPFKSYYIDIRPTTSEYLETLSAIQTLRSMSEEFASKQATLADFVRFIELNISTGRVIANETWFVSGEQAVQLLTVHKSKGLEFDNVFVVDANESMWKPKVGGRSSPANLQLQAYGENYDDYIRLLYVAISRARRCFIASSYFTDDKGNQLLPTPLLSALPMKEIKNPPEDPIEVLENDLRWPVLSSSDEQTILANRLEKFELSPSSFIDFINLAEAGPASFKERHLLRLPTEHSAQGSYGTAIHAALETAQRLVNESKLNLGTVLDRFEAALRDQNMSPTEHDQYKIRGHQLLPELIKNAKLILPKNGKTELKITGVMLGDARIKGALDRVDTTSDAVIIGDYKTGNPLNSFDTKDQTKIVKAWRHKTQLQFYALLARESGLFKGKEISGRMLYVEAEQISKIILPLQPTSAELERLSKTIGVVWKHIIKLDFPDVSKYSPDMRGILKFEEDLIKGRI